MPNRIYFFSGTGNSLCVAKAIAAVLPECELMAVRRGTSPEIPAGYERIGFVFPDYAGGPPSMVADFIRDIAHAKSGVDIPFRRSDLWRQCWERHCTDSDANQATGVEIALWRYCVLFS